MSGKPESTAHVNWRAHAEAVQEAHRAVHEAYRAYRARPGDRALKAAWEAAAARFHRTLTEYPAAFWQDLNHLTAGDANVLPSMLAFLEADPWYFRSGYAKTRVLKAITRRPLPPEAVARLQQVVLDAVDGRDRREFRWYCRLARRVITPEFLAALEARRNSDDPAVQRRARWVLDAIAKHGPIAPGDA
ncbi:MAG: hypothetical protein JXN59_06455 [Anaerolineae bacterium]|nr:hypothetical protein [Anaerolineae bacterium]